MSPRLLRPWVVWISPEWRIEIFKPTDWPELVRRLSRAKRQGWPMTKWRPWVQPLYQAEIDKTYSGIWCLPVVATKIPIETRAITRSSK